MDQSPEDPLRTISARLRQRRAETDAAGRAAGVGSARYGSIAAAQAAGIKPAKYSTVAAKVVGIGSPGYGSIAAKVAGAGSPAYGSIAVAKAAGVGPAKYRSITAKAAGLGSPSYGGVQRSALTSLLGREKPGALVRARYDPATPAKYRGVAEKVPGIGPARYASAVLKAAGVGPARYGSAVSKAAGTGPRTYGSIAAKTAGIAGNGATRPVLSRLMTQSKPRSGALGRYEPSALAQALQQRDIEAPAPTAQLRVRRTESVEERFDVAEIRSALTLGYNEHIERLERQAEYLLRLAVVSEAAAADAREARQRAEERADASEEALRRIADATEVTNSNVARALERAEKAESRATHERRWRWATFVVMVISLGQTIGAWSAIWQLAL